MSAILRFSNANPVRMVITTWDISAVSQINVDDREYKFFKDFSLPSFDSFFQPLLNTSNISVQFDSSFDDDNTIYLKNYYTGATVSSNVAVVIDNRTTYNVLERSIVLTGLDGLYYVEVSGSMVSPPGDPDSLFVARSEPLSIRPSHCNAVKMEYSNDDTAFGIDYENSFIINFYLIIPAFFNRTADTAETETFKDSGGNNSLVSAKGTRARVLKASELLPQWFIEKVNLVLLHDNVTIDGVAVSADQQWPYELISDKQLWGEPEANITLASGSSDYINAHKI